MERLMVLLLSALLVAVTVLGFVIYRAADQAHDDQDELACIQRAQATASIALLAPEENIDPSGRLQAIKTLSTQLDGC